jgi:hypothetical protein
MLELPHEEGGCLGPEAVEKLESYPLSYSEEFCILEAERDRKEVYTDYVGGYYGWVQSACV